MKCLSLWQPWATLLVGGAKRVETRGWPIRHRGPLLIHAAKKWDSDLRMMCHTEPFASALEAIGLGEGPDCGLPFGAVVGRVDVVECFGTRDVSVGRVAGSLPHVMDGESPRVRVLCVGPTERAFGDYGPARFAFLCRNPVRFATPIPCRGMQGIFDVPDELIPSGGLTWACD